MPLATYASLTLARFDSLLEPQSVEPQEIPGTMFLGAAGDIRVGAVRPGFYTSVQITFGSAFLG